MTDRVIIETGNGEYEILPNRALTRIRRIEPRSEPRSGSILTPPHSRSEAARTSTTMVKAAQSGVYGPSRYDGRALYSTGGTLRLGTEDSDESLSESEASDETLSQPGSSLVRSTEVSVPLEESVASP